MNRIQSSRRLDGSNEAPETITPTPNPESRPNRRSSWLQTVLNPTDVEPIKDKNGTRNVRWSNSQQNINSLLEKPYQQWKEYVNWTPEHTNIFGQMLESSDISDSKKGFYKRFSEVCIARGYAVPGTSAVYQRMKALPDEQRQQLKGYSSWVQSHSDIITEMLSSPEPRNLSFKKFKSECARKQLAYPSPANFSLKLTALKQSQSKP